jgi:hypothetical protein
MSIYQVTQYDWPCGNFVVPVGSVIDDVSGQDPMSQFVIANKFPPPPNAMFLMRSTYDALVAAQGQAKSNLYTPPASWSQTIVPTGTSQSNGCRRGQNQ